MLHILQDLHTWYVKTLLHDMNSYTVAALVFQVSTVCLWMGWISWFGNSDLQYVCCHIVAYSAKNTQFGKAWTFKMTNHSFGCVKYWKLTVITWCLKTWLGRHVIWESSRDFEAISEDQWVCEIKWLNLFSHDVFSTRMQVIPTYSRLISIFESRSWQ